MKTLAQIAAELEGYDPQALPADLVGGFLDRLVEPVTDRETVALFDALDRVLAEDIVSPIDVPPHDNSAMDGYAFTGAALGDGSVPTALRIVGATFAGDPGLGAKRDGECVKITTGAVMPAGFDTVVPQEVVTLAGEVVAIPAGVVRTGDNRRLRGEDVRAGRVALARGERLRPAALGLLASLGIARAPVLRRLRVAYFSTGDEVLSLGEAPREGAVYDSNRYTVFGLLTRLGCEVVDLGVVRDEPAALEAAFVDAASRADAVITSGGVSVGEADFTKAMMNKLGDVAFWRIAMRPGRPMAVGRLPRGQFQVKSAKSPGNTVLDSYLNDSNRAAILFGLPGNPVAVMVTFLAFVRPALLRMMGAHAEPLPLLQARSVTAIRKKPGRTEYQRGRVTAAPDGTLEVRIAGNQGSGVLSSMVEANGLVVLPHASGDVAIDDGVSVMMFDGAI